MAYDIDKHLEQLRAEQRASEAEFLALLDWAEKDAKVGQVMLGIAAGLLALGAVLKVLAISMS